MTEKEKMSEASCDIWPKDFMRYVSIKYTDNTGKYFVVGYDYDPNLQMYREEIPIAMTDFFYEAEEEAWKWIEAGPRMS